MVEGAGVFAGLLERQTLLHEESASIETSMSALRTPTWSTIFGARLLPSGYSFGAVVCLEGRLPSRCLLFDEVAVWVAEDLGMCRNEEDPY